MVLGNFELRIDAAFRHMLTCDAQDPQAAGALFTGLIRARNAIRTPLQIRQIERRLGLLP